MNKNVITLAVKYIEDHPTEELSVEMLAKKFGFNVDGFSRSFRKYVGISTSSYISRQRLALAARELLDGAVPSELYSKYGFETHSGFSKAFKKYYNISPSEYKAQWEDHLEPAMYQSFPALTCICYLLEPPSADFPLSEAGAYWYGKDFSFSNISPEDWAKILDPEVGSIGAWMPAPPEKGGKVYAFGPIVKSTDYVPEHMHIVTLPAARYVVFKVPYSSLNSEMHRHIVYLWNKLHELWFANGKLHGDSSKIAFELYKGFETYIYVPITDAPDSDLNA